MRYIDLSGVIGRNVCIFCSHREIASIQLDDSPTILIAGSIVVTACAIYNRSAKSELSENDDLDDYEPNLDDSDDDDIDKALNEDLPPSNIIKGRFQLQAHSLSSGIFLL